MPEKIIAIQSDELGTLYFSTSDSRVDASSTRSGTSKITRSGDKSTPEENKTASSFEKSLETVKKVAQKVVANILDIEMMPDEVECKIGVTFNSEAGVVFAKVGSECNLELTLKWTKAKKEEPKPKV